MRQCFSCHTAQRKVAAFCPVFGIKAEKGQHINGGFKGKELVAVSLIAEITGFIRTADILPEFIGCSPAVGVSGNTGYVLRSAVPSYKHHIVAGVLVNIPGGDKGIDNAPVKFAFFCQIFYTKAVSYRISNSGLEKWRADMWYMDDTALKFARYEPTTGHRPEAENEIMADTKTLDALGVPAELGTTVTLDYQIKGVSYSKDFELCGFWETDSLSNIGRLIVSKAFINR